MTKITKQDFKNNKKNCIYIAVYTIILALIYGYWMICKYQKDECWLIPAILAPILIFIAGCVFLYLSLLKVAKQRVKESNNDEEEINTAESLEEKQ